MPDFTFITATAIVKARDGSSINDWDPDVAASPPDQHLADPDRIHAAVQALEDGGLTVDAIGDFTITFSGSAYEVGQVIGDDIDTTDAQAPSWSNGQPNLTLDAGHSLASQLASVSLEPPTDSYARSYGSAEATAAEVLDTDLLIGEVGESVSPGFPKRLNDGDPLPIADIHARTKKSIADWKTAFGKLRRSNVPRSAILRRRVTRIAIVEGSGGFGIEKLLKTYDLDDDGTQRAKPLFAVKSKDNDQRAVYQASGGWKDYHPAKAELVIELLYPTVRRALSQGKRAVEASVPYRFVDGDTDSNAATLLKAIEPLPKLFNDTVGYLTLLQKTPVRKDGTTTGFHNLAGIDAVKITASAQRLDALLNDAAWTQDKVAARLDDFRCESLDPLRELLFGLVSLMLDERNWALQVMEFHSQMAVVAVQSLAAAASVPTTLCAHSQTTTKLWSNDRAGTDQPSESRANVVMSASFGRAIPKSAGSWGPLIERRRQETASRLTDKHTLYVLAASNNGVDEGRPSQNLAWSGADNVILVGGCEPVRNTAQNRLEWLASDATHGYRFTIGAKTYILPDICATTKGQGGGSVIYPTFSKQADVGVLGRFQQGPWRTGGGSSLSAPVLAGLAATVWRYFSELSAHQLKQVLVRSAQPLDGGSFHIPTNLLATEKTAIVSGSNQVSPANPHPAGRAQLTAALVEAARVQNADCGKSIHAFLQSGNGKDTP